MRLQRRLQLVNSVTEGPNTMIKVAFASSDLKQVDQHFGAAKAFAIYALDAQSCQLVEASEFEHHAMDGSEDKLAIKMAALKDCVAVYSQAVGASAIRQLKELGIQPVKVQPGAQIKELIEQLQAQWAMGPEGWLAKAVYGDSQGKDAGRFDQMAEEGWEE